MISIICILLEIYLLVFLVRIFMSWIPPTPGTTYARIYEGLDRVTEPVLAPVRAVLPPLRLSGMALDLSPIVVFLVGRLLIRAIC